MSNSRPFNLESEKADALDRLDTLVGMFLALVNPNEHDLVREEFNKAKQDLENLVSDDPKDFSDKVRPIMFPWEAKLFNSISILLPTHDPASRNPYDALWNDSFKSFTNKWKDFNISVNNNYKEDQHIPHDKLTYFVFCIMRLDYLGQLDALKKSDALKGTENLEKQNEIINSFNEIGEQFGEQSASYEIVNDIPHNIERLETTLFELSQPFEKYLQVNNSKPNPYSNDLANIKKIRVELKKYQKLLSKDPDNNSKINMDDVVNGINKANMMIADINKKILNNMSEKITPVIDQYLKSTLKKNKSTLKKNGKQKYIDFTVYGDTVYLVKNKNRNRKILNNKDENKIVKKIDKKDTVKLKLKPGDNKLKLKPGDKLFHILHSKGAIDAINYEFESNPKLALTSKNIAKIGHLPLDTMSQIIDEYVKPVDEIDLSSSSSLVSSRSNTESHFEDSIDNDSSSLVNSSDSESEIEKMDRPEVIITANPEDKKIKKPSPTFDKNKTPHIEPSSMFHHDDNKNKLYKRLSTDKKIKKFARKSEEKLAPIAFFKEEKQNEDNKDNKLTRTYTLRQTHTLGQKHKTIDVKNDVISEDNAVKSVLSSTSGIKKLGRVQQAEIAKVWIESGIQQAIDNDLINTNDDIKSINITINFGSLSNNKEFMKNVALFCKMKGYNSLQFNPPQKQSTQDEIKDFRKNVYQKLEKVTVKDIDEVKKATTVPTLNKFNKK